MRNKTEMFGFKVTLGDVSPSVPPVVSTVDSVCRSPPGCPSSSSASSQVPTHPSLCCSCSARMRLPGGRNMSCLWTVCVCFSSNVLPVTQFLPCLIVFIGSGVFNQLPSFSLVLYIKCCMFLVSFVWCYVYVGVLRVSPACLLLPLSLDIKHCDSHFPHLRIPCIYTLAQLIIILLRLLNSSLRLHSQHLSIRCEILICENKAKHFLHVSF